MLSRTMTAGIVAIATLASSVVWPVASSASTDPEMAYSQRARSLPTEADVPATLPTPRTLVSSAQANGRIAHLVPRRMSYPSVGRHLAVAVMDTADDRVVISRRLRQPMLPASNMKIVTAVNALRTFGPDHRFSTEVVSLQRGQLAIVGGGDTTLGRTGINRLSALITKSLRDNPDTFAPAPGGQLHVFYDDSLYPTPVRPAGWRSGYEPSVVRPVRALGIDGDYSMDSARNAAALLVKSLRQRGHRAVLRYRKTAPAQSPVMASFEGATVADQIRYMLLVSENNVAEMMFRNVAVAHNVVPTWTNSRVVATRSLRSLGVPTAGLALASGSGVSRADRLTALSLVTLLDRIAERENYPELASIYYGGGLPLAGRTGTLSASTGRYTTRPTSCARGRLRAKTGTLFDTTALSGLTTGTDGELKAFAILVNSRPQRFSQLTTRRNIDRIAATVNGCY